MNIHWYPGHMTKTFRIIEANLKLVDACVELRDARIPLSSANPRIDEITKDKPRLILLNKADLADDKQTPKWVAYFATQGIKAIPVEASNGKGIKQLQTALREATQNKRRSLMNKGIKGFAARAMILGIPNVGKSTLINTINKSKVTKTADKAGVTRGKQWIKVSDELELMDLPGVLWPKIEDQTSAKYLAFTGCINDDAIDKLAMIEDLALYLNNYHAECLQERYKYCEHNEYATGNEVLEVIARKRGLILSGNRVDVHRAGEMLLNEFRGGKLGRFTLDTIPT